MSSKRFSKAQKTMIGLWALALMRMSAEAREASVESYPEDSEFACQWWNDIYNETVGRSCDWEWMMKKKGRIS